MSSNISAAPTPSGAAANKNNNNKYVTGYKKYHVYKKLVDLIEQFYRSTIKVPRCFKENTDLCISVLTDALIDVVYATENYTLKEKLDWLTSAVDKIHWVTINSRILFDLKLLTPAGAAALNKLEDEAAAQLSSWKTGLQSTPNNGAPKNPVPIGNAIHRANISLIKNIKY